jgi:hypothetical protein
LGVHSQAANGTSRWFAIDIDYHTLDDHTGSREANYLAATTWFKRLQSSGFDPLLMDSNGDGGYHLLQFFSSPMNTDTVRMFMKELTSDYQTLGLDEPPIHSYQSGWQGAGVVADPPIHKVDIAIRKLRKDYRIVVHSARCNTEEGRTAIANWLVKHKIEVDEICEHKPPSHVYVDDRAVQFSGDWEKTIADVKAFRK